MDEEKLFIEAQLKLSDLIKREQGRLGLTNFQMSQRINVHSRSYDRLINGKVWAKRGCSLAYLCSIFANTSITPNDVFGGVN